MEPLRSKGMVPLSVAIIRWKKKCMDGEAFTRVGFNVRKSAGRKGINHRYIQHLQKNEFSPKVILRCDTPTAVKEAVRKKLGVGVLYRNVVASEVDRGELKIIKTPGGAFVTKSFIIYHKHRSLSPSAQEFLALLRRYKQKSQ